MLRVAINEADVGEAGGAGHLREVGQGLGEVVGGDVGAGFVEVVRAHGGPLGAHVVEVALEIVFATLAGLAGHIEEDEGAAGFQAGGAGIEESLLARGIEMMDGVA